MIGALLVVVAMLVMIPLLFVVGGVLFVFLGWSVQKEVEDTHLDSPFLELNR